MPVILNADNGAVSGISGLTTSADNSGVLQFQSSGTATVTITTAGNVGVGTSSPASKLTVAGGNISITQSDARLIGGDASGRLILANSDVTTYAVAYGSSHSTSAGQFHIASGSNVMIFNSSGNLGLGVTPSAWSVGKAMQIGNTSVSFNDGSGNTYWGNNFYYNANFLYSTTNNAVSYVQTASGQHRWNTAPSGTAGNAITFTQAMTLNASGQLLLGTTSAIGGENLTIGNGSGSTFTSTYLNAGSGGNSLVGRISGSNTWFIGDTVAAIGSGTGMMNYVYGANPWIVYTNAAERMRIDSSGRLMLGTTSGSSRATIGFLASTGGLTITTADDNALYCQYLRSGVTFVDHKISGSTYQIVNFSAGVSLAASGTSWGSLSDERQKDIIEPITNAAEKVSSLRAVIGKYKTDEEGKRRAFLIAQDVQAVLPEAVYQNSDEDDTLNLAYTDTIPLLVAAIKEQQAIINDLKAEVEALKARG